MINAAAVTNEEISQEHADFVISMFRDLLPSNSDAVLGGQGTAAQLAMVEQLRATRRLCHLFKHMHKDFSA